MDGLCRGRHVLLATAYLGAEEPASGQRECPAQRRSGGRPECRSPDVGQFENQRPDVVAIEGKHPDPLSLDTGPCAGGRPGLSSHALAFARALLL